MIAWGGAYIRMKCLIKIKSHLKYVTYDRYKELEMSSPNMTDFKRSEIKLPSKIEAVSNEAVFFHF